MNINETKSGNSIRVRFAGRVKQVDTNVIEIEVAPTNGPVFHPDFVHDLEHEVGKRPASAMLDELAEQLMLKQVTAGMTIS